MKITTHLRQGAPLSGVWCGRHCKRPLRSTPSRRLQPFSQNQQARDCRGGSTGRRIRNQDAGTCSQRASQDQRRVALKTSPRLAWRRVYSALVYDLANTRLAIMGGQISGGKVNDFYTADVTPLFAVRLYTHTAESLETFF